MFAAFETEYAMLLPPRARSPEIDAVLMMCPPPFFRSTDAAACVTKNGALTFTSSTESQSASVTSSSFGNGTARVTAALFTTTRSEEHTSELQSQFHLVCRLLLEKKQATMRG